MDFETPIAATEEQLPAADSKRSKEDSGEDSGGAKKLKVEKSAEEDRLDQLEGTEGDKESDRVSVGPKNFGSSMEMFDYFYKFLHYWPPNVNVNKSFDFKNGAMTKGNEWAKLVLPPFLLQDCLPPFTMAIGSTRFFSEDVTHFPDIKDTEILFVFEDLMAASWDELPDALISDANKALSKNTDDKAAQEAVANVFRVAEAVEEFSGMLVSLRMAIDDSTGLGGEDVKPLPEEFVNALRTVYQRYTAYLDAFGPDETYLRKKVETELGTKMIHLKMRCSGIGSEWGKVTVLGDFRTFKFLFEHRA
ncbi:hypothetical protein LOK49_LG13G00106 [Camellia lanceoleosa]|uniref:Uncharacterized protein n=1 Tax=Camellia lanceoleosa TaxID=1840588 RepID=A0ACC0FFU2_9ERIC|nr:hypothetical protein LOK49_LG13G00106 [Camellia lanceoleosa]